MVSRKNCCLVCCMRGCCGLGQASTSGDRYRQAPDRPESPARHYLATGTLYLALLLTPKGSDPYLGCRVGSDSLARSLGVGGIRNRCCTTRGVGALEPRDCEGWLRGDESRAQRQPVRET